MGRDERGFTLTEIMVAVGIMSLLMTMSALGLRGYWLRQSLQRAVGEVTVQLENLQARSVAQSNPVIFGAHFDPEDSQWEIVRFDGGDAGTTSDDTCAVVTRYTMEAGVTPTGGGVDFDVPVSPGREFVLCATAASGSNEELIFFYPRGTSNGGTVALIQPSKPDQVETIEVLPITGRVDVLE